MCFISGLPACDDRGHLVHDHVRPGRGHRLTDRHRIQPVHHDRLGAQLLQQAQLGRARRRRRHLVAPGHELRHQPPPQDPGPACHEHPHDHHLPDLGVGLSARDETARRSVTRGCVPGFPRPHDRHAREARDRSAAALSLQLYRRLLRRPRSSARHVQHQELRGLRRATKASNSGHSAWNASWSGTGRCSVCSLRGCGDAPRSSPQSVHPEEPECGAATALAAVARWK